MSNNAKALISGLVGLICSLIIGLIAWKCSYAFDNSFILAFCNFIPITFAVYGAFKKYSPAVIAGFSSALILSALLIIIYSIFEKEFEMTFTSRWIVCFTFVIGLFGFGLSLYKDFKNGINEQEGQNSNK